MPKRYVKIDIPDHLVETMEASETIPESDIEFTAGDRIVSNPPSGKYKVTNLYIENGKLAIEFDNTPIE